MRVRITDPLTGSVDGIELDRFRVGEMYDVGTSLANYLMAMGVAAPMADESPARLTALDQPALVAEIQKRIAASAKPLAVAADRPSRRKREKR